MSAFITRWYLQLHAAKVYDAESCWDLVCECVSRIFDEIHLVRASARDAYIQTDAATTCDTYIWATLRAHEVMDKFVLARFDDHPSMASVITKFAVKHSPVSHAAYVKGDIDKVQIIMVRKALSGPR